MRKTAVVFSPIFTKHNPGMDHPESARRVTAVIREIEKRKVDFDARLQFVQPEKASREDVELVHAREYVRLVEAVCRAGGGPLDSEDTVVSRDSFEVALYAVGGALRAVNLVMERKFENAFALVRPPGHHAERFRALGFCIFNNVAIAAQILIKKYELNKVLILDIDAHHGNGTQKEFYGTQKVLYMSLHEDPTDFPRTGFMDEVGRGEGAGYTVNIPLPYGTGDHVYLRAVREIVTPIAHQYEPEFILLSAGFDSHYLDPIGNLSLSAKCFEQILETVTCLASRLCDRKLVGVLEGGYNVKNLGQLAVMAIAKMSMTEMKMAERPPIIKRNAISQGEKIIEETKKTQSSFWKMY